MASVRETWAAMTVGSRLGAIALGVATVAVVGGLVGGGAVVASGALATPTASSDTEAEVEPTPLPPGSSVSALPPEPTPNPSASDLPTPTPTPAGADPLLGTDGRLTVLLLGSDYRPAHPGNRTDAIMVVSVDPASGKTAAFSVPRDTSGFPLPERRPLRQQDQRPLPVLPVERPERRRASMEAAFSKAFGIEIDGYVFIGFSGVKNLVDAVGGVDVVLSKAYYDPYYFVNNHHQGWGLPAGKSHLNGAKALIFARSAEGRQRLRPGPPAADPRGGGDGEGPLARADDPAPAPQDRPRHRPDRPAARSGGRPLRGHLAGEPEDRGQGGLRPSQVRRRDRRIVLVRAQAGRLPGLDRGALPAGAAVRDVAGRRSPRLVITVSRPGPTSTRALTVRPRLAGRVGRAPLLEGAGVDLVGDRAHVADHRRVAPLVLRVAAVCRPCVERDAGRLART